MHMLHVYHKYLDDAWPLQAMDLHAGNVSNKVIGKQCPNHLEIIVLEQKECFCWAL